mgnify:CR=1 FL=1
MAKPLAASKKVMKNYLSELLTEESAVQESIKNNAPASVGTNTVENKRLETLLKNVNSELEVRDTNVVTQKSITEQDENEELIEQNTLEPLYTHKSTGNVLPRASKAYRNGNFQALFFNVGGLTVAVPLIELGGIHNIEKTTTLMGKPDWFKGVMLYRDEKINVVDTALWVMPEKCDEKLKSSLNYQYVIMLSDSSWGLTAETLVDTVVLSQDEVKWLDAPSKRPWLAGLVKDKMCALLDVDALIQLLNDGSTIHQDD